MGIKSALALMTAAALLVAGCSSSKAGTGSAGTPLSTPASTTSSATAPTTSPAPSTSSADVMTSTTPAPSTTAMSSPTTSTGPNLGAFAGKWIGHERTVTISAAGLGQEFVGDGCCTSVLSVSFKITATSTSGANQVATVQVVTATAGSEYTGTPPKAGDTGTFTLKGGVLTDSFGGNTFCDSAQEQAGTCGA